MRKHARYDIVQSNAACVVIRDVGPWDTHPTVTNDAEWVVLELTTNGALNGRRLFYFDSSGDLDEIVIRDGHFVTFAPGGPDGRRLREGDDAI